VAHRQQTELGEYMITLKFKAGNDVPEYIARPTPDCAPLKHIKFAMDVEAFFYHGSWHVLPTEPLGERAIFSIKAEKPDSFVSVEGGPTITYEFPMQDYQHHMIQSWAEAAAARPANYGDRSADPYEISVPRGAALGAFQMQEISG